MSLSQDRVLEAVRDMEDARAARQDIRRWHRRSGRQWGIRLLRALTRGCQLGSAFAVIGYLAIDFTGFLYRPDVFRVPHITVRGNTRVTSYDLLRTARLAPSMQLFAWPLADIRARAEAHPRVRVARVYREFPDELILEIEERQPLALLLGEPLLEIDADGVVLGPYERGRSPQGPILSGFATDGLTAGVRVDAPAVREALAVVASYLAETAPGRVPIAEVAVAPPAAPVLWLQPGVQVPCASGMDAAQWARLSAVLSDLRARGTGLHRVAAIDLRFAHVVPVRLRMVAAG